MFFRRAVDILRQTGRHEILCTSRWYREAVELARIKQLDLTVVGKHGGSDRYEKLRQSSTRTYELAEVINKFGADIAISFSSPEAARVAYGLGIHQIGFNDSPHAEAVARLTIPLIGKLYCPWVVPYSAWAGYGIPRKNVVNYRALDPAAWLKHDGRVEPKPDYAKKVLIRLEESKASYVADRKLGAAGMIDGLINSLHQSADIVVLGRYEDQIGEVEGRYGRKVRVIRDVVDGTKLINSVGLFVGAGGTMTAEAALMGKPTISIAPFNFYVERYLIKSGLVRKATNPKSLVNLARKMIADKKVHQLQSKRAARILGAMEDPTDKMIAAINAVRL